MSKFLMLDELEVMFMRINDLNDGGASLVFRLHSDDATDDLFNAMRHRKGRRFKISMIEIGDDELPVAAE